MARTILIADDDEDMRQLLVATMHQAGYRVHTACTGTEAKALARTIQPDVVVTDVNMPDGDGWGLVTELRSRAETAEIPIIFVSSLSGQHDRIRALRIGVDDHIPKPFTVDELIRRIERALLVADAKRQRDSTASP